MDRVNRMLELAELKPDQGIIIHKPSNVFYLSGYAGEGLLFLSHQVRAVVTDFRYTEQAGNEAKGFTVYAIEPGVSHARLAANLARQAGVQHVLYEDDKVTVKAFAQLQEAFEGMTFAPLNQLPEKLRVTKDSAELEFIARACHISCKAFDHICKHIKPGQTEKDIQLELDFQLLKLGGDGLAFSTIVASGPNGSLPHAVPGDRVVQPGDMITLDFGAKYRGYCSDMTRTVSVGEPSKEMRRIYDIVLAAQKAAQAALAPGKNCKDIDSIARDMIAAESFGNNFGHGLGHAVGIDIHEEPRLSQTSTAVLEPGMVVTVEPGIYVPGLGGVRIENSCVITEDGAKSLVDAPRELIIL